MLTEQETIAWEKYQAEAKERYIKSAAWLAERVASTFPSLTVGELRARLEGVPDDALVLYQRIEDVYFETHGWKTVSLVWEREDEYSEYVPSFSAYKTTAADGRAVFVINAHY